MNPPLRPCPRCRQPLEGQHAFCPGCGAPATKARRREEDLALTGGILALCAFAPCGPGLPVSLVSLLICIVAAVQLTRQGNRRLAPWLWIAGGAVLDLAVVAMFAPYIPEVIREAPRLLGGGR